MRLCSIIYNLGTFHSIKTATQDAQHTNQNAVHVGRPIVLPSSKWSPTVLHCRSPHVTWRRGGATGGVSGESGGSALLLLIIIVINPEHSGPARPFICVMSIFFSNRSRATFFYLDLKISRLAFTSCK